MPPKSAPQEPSVPAPEVNITKTKQWLQMKDPEMLNPFERMVANNLEVIASQNSKTHALIEGFGQKVTDNLKRGRGSSQGSRRSSLVSEEGIERDDEQGERTGEDAGGDDDGTEEIEMSGAGGNEGMPADIYEANFNLLADSYRTFIDAKKKPNYVNKTPKSIQDATHFKTFLLEEHLPGLFGDDEEHPLPDVIRGMQNAAIVTLYIDLAKKHKASTKGKGKAAKKAPPKSSKDAPDPPRSAMRRTDDPQGTAVTGKKRTLTQTESGHTAIESMISDEAATPRRPSKRSRTSHIVQDEDEDEEADDEQMNVD